MSVEQEGISALEVVGFSDQSKRIPLRINTEHHDFLDLALAYALINFIGVIAVLRLVAHGEFHSPGNDNIEPVEAKHK